MCIPLGSALHSVISERGSKDKPLDTRFESQTSLAQRRWRGGDGLAITVSELLPNPMSSASLEDEERSSAHTLLVPHPSFHACFDDGEGR